MTRLSFMKRVKGLISLLLCLTLIVTSVKFPTLASEFDGGSNSNGENEFVSGSFEFPSSQYYNYELKGDFYYNDDYFKNPATTYDEHTAALDPKTANLVLTLTKEIVDKDKITTLMITHNMRDALSYGNRLIMMDQGRIIFDAQGEEKAKLTVEDLLKKFNQTKDAPSDAMILG